MVNHPGEVPGKVLFTSLLELFNNSEQGVQRAAHYSLLTLLLHPSQRLNTRAALVPPKPKELDRA